MDQKKLEAMLQKEAEEAAQLMKEYGLGDEEDTDMKDIYRDLQKYGKDAH